LSWLLYRRIIKLAKEIQYQSLKSAKAEHENRGWLESALQPSWDVNYPFVLRTDLRARVSTTATIAKIPVVTKAKK